MTELSPQERALIDMAQGGDDPTAAARARMRANVLAQIGVGAGAAAAGTLAAGAATAASAGASTTTATAAKATTAAVATTATASWFSVGKVALGLSLAVSVGGGGYLVTQGVGTNKVAIAPSLSATPAVATAVPSEPNDDAQPADESGKDEPTTDDKRAEAPTANRYVWPPAGKPAGSNWRDELGLLRDVQKSLNEGDGDAALKKLDEHEKKHGKGKLSEERRAARVFALCKAGRKKEARAAAAHFLSTSPRSPLAPRVAAACR